MLLSKKNRDQIIKGESNKNANDKKSKSNAGQPANNSSIGDISRDQSLQDSNYSLETPNARRSAVVGNDVM
jgi:hypothetical protein